MSPPATPPAQLQVQAQAPAESPIAALLHILRRANARSSALAATVRNTFRPTHHARKRACALQLTVSVRRARALDQRHVSTLPLPILERDASPSPPPQMTLAQEEEEDEDEAAQRPIPIPTVRTYPQGQITVVIPAAVVAPVPMRMTRSRSNAYRAQGSGGVPATTAPSPIRRPARPVLRCAIPAGVQSPGALLVSAGTTAPPSPVDMRSHWETSDEESPGAEVEVEADAGVLRAGLVQEEDRHARTTKRPRLDVPIDVSRLSWSSTASYCTGASSSGSYSSGSSSSASTSASSAAGPVTPDDGAPLACEQGTKRKPSGSFLDMDEEESPKEKRPKYERKTWMQQRGPRRF